MNIRFTRESAILLLVLGVIIAANPNLWWLIFVFGGIFWNNMGQSSRRDEGERRSRRASERARERDLREMQRGPRLSVQEEMRRQRQTSRGRELSRSRNGQRIPGTYPSSEARRPASARQPNEPLSHAADAVFAAGHEPEDLALLPVDIGFMVYSGDTKPVVHREAPIPDTVDFIQPYVELYLERPAAGTLRFEIIDADGEIRYSREERRQLKAGRTPVIPATRMPMGDFLDTAPGWALRVYAANTLIAEHGFGWIDPDTANGDILREHLFEDGELSADLAILVEEAELQPMSLDDLLEEPKAAARQQR